MALFAPCQTAHARRDSSSVLMVPAILTINIAYDRPIVSKNTGTNRRPGEVLGWRSLGEILRDAAAANVGLLHLVELADSTK